ncbi:unnamed protein product [Symbiodinium natans]|uniref:AAA+ ATPase domain-containing protein n=1 Tax=Symbiodinium natans TaxID=878477 RepID=A0A812UAI2_9DINO|nr:unnamed protein product [Symbiodinium natans]
MDRFLVNPRPKPQPKPMPKPANLMEEVISIKHDESLVENPGLHAVAWEVPVIIRGVRRTGRNAGNGYERTKYLPVTTLNATLSRQSDGLSEFQVRRNVKAAVLAQLGNPEPNDIIMELSDETYYLDPAREWTFSSQVMQVVNDQVEVEDKLCVARQLAELMRLPLQEVLSDFDAICPNSKWREQGVSPKEIREFCVWRGAPMFYVDCQGRLLDKYEPTVKEQRAVAFTSWNGHAFFYKSARTVAKCEPGQVPGRQEAERSPRVQGVAGVGGRGRERSLLLRGPGAGPGRAAGRGPLPEGGHARRCLRLRVRGGGDCVISNLDEDAEVLEAWMGRLRLPYRGQRLAGAASEVFLPGSREAVLAEQDHLCKLRGPHRQALCLECHRNKTALEFSHPTTLESRFSRRAYKAYVESPRLPPLVFHLNSHKPDRICHGVDVVRCRKNTLANAKFPVPVFCPKDNVEPAREGHLADLTYVELKQDRRCAVLRRLPYVGRGWYSKPAAAYMLERGVATWADFAWSLDATAHVDQESVAQALQQMEEAWPEGEEHYAKLSVNALGAQHGGMHWDHIYVTQLLSNKSCRPIHDFVMASEYVAVARIRDALATVPPKYLKAIKTDCVVFQDLPKKYQPLLDGLVRKKHRRHARVPVRGGQGPRGPVPEPVHRSGAREQPVQLEARGGPGLEGESLLLTGYPGTGKTHLARQIVTRLREEGFRVKIITKTHSSVQNGGTQAETADHWVRSSIRNGYCNVDWLVVEEITMLDTGLWSDIACLSMNRQVNFLLLGDFRQFPAVMDNFAGAQVIRELKTCQLLHDLTRGWHHQLTENRRSDPGIFDFLRWLRVEEAQEQPLPEALRVDQRPGQPPCGSGPAIGAGGRVIKGIYVHVTEVGPEKIVLDGGDSFTHAALLKHTRLCHAITYASCQGLTLEGRHLYVGSSRVRHFEQVAGVLQRLLVGVPEVDSGQIDLELDEAVPRRQASLGQLALDVLLDRLQVCLGGLVLLETQGESPGLRLAAVGAGVPQDAQPLAGPPGLRAHREELAATLVGRKLTELDGTGSVGRAFEARGWQVTSQDSNPKARASICSDILQWDYKAFEPGHFDMVWASPCCTEFSIALKKRPRNLPVGDALVLKTFEIIDYLKPKWWAIENPSTGRLKTRPYMQGLHMDRVTYCKYGFRYKKPTAGPCRKGDRCEAFQGTRHPEAAQRGPTKGRQGSNSRDQLYSIPPALCDEIAASATLGLNGQGGKTVLLVSMILEQYRGCFERIYIFSPSVEVDSAWQPVKDYIRDELGVNTDREQCWWEDWDEGALRKIIADQKRITQKSKELGLKKLYQVLVILDDHADNPAVHRKTGDGLSLVPEATGNGEKATAAGRFTQDLAVAERGPRSLHYPTRKAFAHMERGRKVNTCLDPGRHRVLQRRWKAAVSGPEHDPQKLTPEISNPRAIEGRGAFKLKLIQAFGLAAFGRGREADNALEVSGRSARAALTAQLLQAGPDQHLDQDEET